MLGYQGDEQTQNPDRKETTTRMRMQCSHKDSGADRVSSLYKTFELLPYGSSVEFDTLEKQYVHFEYFKATLN